MLKIRVVLIAVGICAIVVAVFVLRSRKAESPPQNQTSTTRSGGLNEILEALTLSLPTNSLGNDRETINKGLQRRQDALEKLRANVPAYLPLLMEEVHAIGAIAATDREKTVRRIAEVAIRTAIGEIPPDKVQ